MPHFSFQPQAHIVLTPSRAAGRAFVSKGNILPIVLGVSTLHVFLACRLLCGHRAGLSHTLYRSLKLWIEYSIYRGFLSIDYSAANGPFHCNLHNFFFIRTFSVNTVCCVCYLAVIPYIVYVLFCCISHVTTYLPAWLSRYSIERTLIQASV